MLLVTRAWILLTLVQPWLPGAELERFPSQFRDPSLFLEAIQTERMVPLRDRHVTGITVPHHLMVPDLMARGFWSAAAGKYDRLLILSPDHFSKSRSPFATTRRGFETSLGPVEIDREAVDQLLKRNSDVKESELFAGEHGIQSLLPFAAHFFPGIKVLPLALRIDSRESQWRELAEALKPLVTDRTLIIQSTDFSHYLPRVTACRRDQETMNVISAGDPAAITRLIQPDHVDSRAALWLQMVLQRECFGAEAAIVANRNAEDYSPYPLQRSTSYVVQLFEKPKDSPRPWPVSPGQHLFYFAGDTFFGRFLVSKLTNPERADRIRERILGITGGHPLVVNLEGVMLPQVPAELERWPLVMPEDLALDWLKALHVQAVSLANNHAMDLNQEGMRRTRAALEKAGVRVLEHGECLDLGPFRMVAYTDLSNRGPDTAELVTASDLGILKKKRLKPPLFAFLHWGREFEPQAGPREEALTSELFENGVSVLVGAHPHTASRGVEAFQGGAHARAYSLGNLLFDQPDERASGALLEVRFFAQGTYALRWCPIGNLYTNP